MYNEDYILRQIEICTQVINNIIFNAGQSIVEFDLESSDYIIMDDLSITLMKYVEKGNINEAEDILFENVNKNPSAENFKIAMEFYERLNQLSNSQLISYDFSKEEISQGIEDIKKIYII